MLPGPPKIVVCASCGAFISDPTYLSWNTFDSKLWSDGKNELPMAPQELPLMKCWNCNTLQSIDELPVAKDPRDSDSKKDGGDFSSARDVLLPTFADYIEYLSAELTAKQIFYTRLHAWWQGNDKRRESEQDGGLSDSETDNLLAFIELLDETDVHQLIMKAEAFRELGGFSRAKELLNGSFPAELEEIAEFQRELNDRRIKSVVEVEVGN